MKSKFLVSVMILIFSFCAFAQDAQNRTRIIGDAFEEEEKARLEELINSVSVKYNFDLVIAIANIGSEDPKVYADSFFERHGYGTGPQRDGCLFLVYVNSDGEADFRFSDSGRGIKILTDTAFRKMETGISQAFLRQDLYEVCRSYILDWEHFLELEAIGRSYNFFYKYNIILVIASWALALAIGLSVVLIWKKKMNTALAQTQADAYTVPGSLNYKTKTDKLLYSNVKKIKIPKASGGSLGKTKRRR